MRMRLCIFYTMCKAFYNPASSPSTMAYLWISESLREPNHKHQISLDHSDTGQVLAVFCHLLLLLILFLFLFIFYPLDLLLWQRLVYSRVLWIWLREKKKQRHFFFLHLLFKVGEKKYATYNVNKLLCGKKIDMSSISGCQDKKVLKQSCLFP